MKENSIAIDWNNKKNETAGAAWEIPNERVFYLIFCQNLLMIFSDKSLNLISILNFHLNSGIQT